jgi:hypothetical protein
VWCNESVSLSIGFGTIVPSIAFHFIIILWIVSVWGKTALTLFYDYSCYLLLPIEKTEEFITLLLRDNVGVKQVEAIRK